MFPRDRVIASLAEHGLSFGGEDAAEGLRYKLAAFYAKRSSTESTIEPEDQAEAIFLLISERLTKTRPRHPGRRRPQDGSVAPTQAGEQLISRLDPALGEVECVLDQIVGLRERPTGRVRLLVTPLSSTMVLAPKLVAFARRFPAIVLDVTTTQEGRTELVASGFDAGIHLGCTAADTIAAPPQRCQAARGMGVRESPERRRDTPARGR